MTKKPFPVPVLCGLLLFVLLGLSACGEEDRNPLQAHTVSYVDSLTNSVSLAVQTRGEGSVIVLVHGNSLGASVWTKQLNGSLGDSYRVLAYDLRGCGASSKLNVSEGTDAHLHYSLKLHAEDLKQVLTQFGVTGATLVGWSLGGNVALQYLNDNPGQSAVARLVLLGTTPSIEQLASEPHHTEYTNMAAQEPAERTALSDPLLAGFQVNPAPTRTTLTNFCRLCFLTETTSTNPSAIALPSGVVQTDVDLLLSLAEQADGWGRVGNAWGADFFGEGVDLGGNVFQFEQFDIVDALTIPTYVIYSSSDLLAWSNLVLMMTNYNTQVTASADLGTGHAPFYTLPDRFQDELTTFISANP